MPFGSETDHDDDSHREEIVFGTYIDWEDNRGGMEYISSLSEFMDSGIGVDTLEELIEKGYVDPEGRQNRGPAMQKLLEFGANALNASEHIDIEYTGYMISPRRPDSRITITGINVKPEDGHRIPDNIVNDFVDEFRLADDFEFGSEHCSAWWD